MPIIILLIFAIVCLQSTAAQAKDDFLKNARYFWGSWSLPQMACSVTCGRGVRCRVRQCLNTDGVVQPTANECIKTHPTSLGEKVCTSCFMFTRCPRQPGWGEWSMWSACIQPPESEAKMFEGCSIGRRFRERLCNNPPPEPPPANLPCVGPGQETLECELFCDPSRFKDDEISKKISRQVEVDLRQPRGEHLQVIRRDEGREVRLNCYTKAFRLARELVLRGRMSSIRAKFADRLVRLKWYKNGQQFFPIHPRQHFRSARTFSIRRHSKLFQLDQLKRRSRRRLDLEQQSEIDDSMLLEEQRWSTEYAPSSSAFEQASLVIPNVEPGDQGFYTCELNYASKRWLTSFFSVIVVGRRLKTQASRAFYLHSNLGTNNALFRGPAWFEAAQLIWYLNGAKYSHGLAIRPDRRIQRIDYVNATQQGVWQCFLILPAFGHAHETVTPGARILRSMLTNEFYLDIEPAPSTLWRLAEQPLSMRYLRNFAVGLIGVDMLLFGLLLFTFWAIYRWVTHQLTLDQVRAILQEIADDSCRLMMSGQRRGEISKARVLPLILLEHRRLQRARETLINRWNLFEGGSEEAGESSNLTVNNETTDQFYANEGQSFDTSQDESQGMSTSPSQQQGSARRRIGRSDDEDGRNNDNESSWQLTEPSNAVNGSNVWWRRGRQQ